MQRWWLMTIVVAWSVLSTLARAQDEAPEEETEAAVAAEAPAEPKSRVGDVIGGLRLRSVGPALYSGRVGDLAVNPQDHSEYYVAIASGGVWKTTNAGVTYQPIFDSQGSYSIGCVTLDPNNPKTVWVGTGENNSQRSVSYGDGVYKSVDGGASWKNVGLKESEHIGMITIDPRDSNVVYVAAQGPLWASGGDRGLYKTTDGGATWERILHISDDTGVNEVFLDPRDPDTVYASAYQRRRHVWTLINGGPESGLHKSNDGGKTWRKINKGLPSVDKGRIGLALSPVNPDVLYAICEAADGQGGIFRSVDRGESWSKRSSYMSSSPQYYNELVACPHNVDRAYSLDTYLHITEDGGRTWTRVPNAARHVDDHALWIDPNNENHLIVGSDGGLYETWDRGQAWQFRENLPVTQFYRVAVDNSEPFYYIYGGTQDNGTMGGPSRTTDRVGITNADWFLVVGGDGFKPQIDPVDPMIVYGHWQHGGLVRHDRRSGEIVSIRPRHRPGEAPQVFNWDTPLLISPHMHTRLYFAGRVLYRSDDRGENWEIVSPDLTRGIDRNTLEVMGKIQKPDAVAKHMSTSIYGNCVALSESRLVEGLLYVGTDDGLIHVTEDGGANWRRIDSVDGVPDLTYVSSLFASPIDADEVFATFDNRRMGDFVPYVYRSDDRGRTWVNISGDLPARHAVYGIVQDHVRAELLFCGTEFGAFCSIDGGEKWHKLKGVPTISVRDLVIQERESDLVLGTFGRGFYVLDDYSALRGLSDELLDAEAVLFEPREAKMYIERSRLGNRDGRGWSGASMYAASNPPYGAVLTYFIRDKFETRKEQRKEAEKNEDWEYPAIEQFRQEDREREPRVIVTIRDSDGGVVRRIVGSRNAGLHRTAWDLRYPAATPISFGAGNLEPWDDRPSGPLAAPGRYSAEVSREVDGKVERLAGPVEFEVVSLNLATFGAEDRASVLAFQAKVARLQRAVLGAQRAAGEAETRLRHLRQAILETPGAGAALAEREETLRHRLDAIQVALRGDSTLSSRAVPDEPSISGRVSSIVSRQWGTTSPPSKSDEEQYRFAGDAFAEVLARLRTLVEWDIKSLEADLEAAGAPWTPGRIPEWKPE